MTMLTRSTLSWRLSGYYTVLFMAVGICMPFWPLWLQSMGLSAADIGLIMASTYLIKILVGPSVGHVVDISGQRRKPMLILALCAASAWACFNLTTGFWSIFCVVLIAQAAWSGFMPVGEALSMSATGRAKLDYGRVRLWGSVSFIIAALCMGQALDYLPISSINWLIAGLLALVAIMIARLPDNGPLQRNHIRLPIGSLIRSPLFLMFLGITALNQASHVAYYAFASLHWKAAGHSDLVIGLLWSQGVVAEIILFAFSGYVVAKLGPRWLLVVAAGSGVLRWMVLGISTDLAALISVQFLHAATFGCAHLGAMHFITKLVPRGLTARAQGIYAAVALGLSPGLASPIAGWLYDTVGGYVFSIMSLLALGSVILGLKLAKTPSATNPH